MENVSILISILFLATVVATILLFWKAANFSRTVIAVILAWVLFQSLLGINGFYSKWDAAPARFPLMIVPPILFIIILFSIRIGRSFINSLNLETLTILHAIRIPVEVSLYYLFVAKLIPRTMTFEGSNFDMVSGITAPVIYYLAFISKKIDWRLLLIWNIFCLGLLLNVVITALLSAKTPIQQFAFDQPNIGVTYFPFVLLPSAVVPIVLFAHLSSIRQILRSKNKSELQKIKLYKAA